jgi:hypothetical protein
MLKLVRVIEVAALQFILTWDVSTSFLWLDINVELPLEVCTAMMDVDYLPMANSVCN